MVLVRLGVVVVAVAAAYERFLPHFGRVGGIHRELSRSLTIGCKR